MNRHALDPGPLRPWETSGSSTDIQLDFARVLQIIRKGWWIIALGAFLGALFAAVMVLRATPTFTATAQIMLGQENRADVTLGNLFQELNLDNADIAGEIAIITSGQILKDVSEQLDLVSRPEFNPALKEPQPEPSLAARLSGLVKDKIKAVLGGDTSASGDQGGTDSAPSTDPVVRAAAAVREQFGEQADYVGALAAGLRVRQVGSTYLVDVSYSSSDRQLAAAVPNVVVDSYLREQLNRKFRAIQRVTAGLDSRLGSLRDRLEASERAVIDYRNQNLADGFGTQERLDQQLRELSSRLGAARAEQVSLASELSEIDTLMESGGAAAAAGLFSSDLLNNLRGEIATIEQRRSQLNNRFGADSSQVRAATEEIDRLQDALATEIARLRNDKVNLEMVARARETALRQQMRALEQQELELSGRAVTMAQLERELAANRVTYETFLGKFTETSEVVDLQEADAQVIAYAKPPASPVAPRRKLGVALGLIAGAALGLGVVFARSIGDNAVSSVTQLRSLVQDAHVQTLPRLRGLLRRPDPMGYVLQAPHSALSESVRSLRGHLLLSAPDDRQSVAMISCGPDAGKTTTSVMLGRSMAQMGKSCILVETDLRRGNVGKMMHMPSRPDIVDVLTGSVTLEEALQPDPHSNMFVLSARTKIKDPAALLMSPQMTQLITRLEEMFEIIIFDTPPLLSTADAVPLIGIADNVVLLVPEGQTTTSELENGMRLLRNASAKLSCAVLSMAREQKGEGYGYY
ncbi:polysaccharide biosynthesis tyrosine autokinase [Ruegeria sp. 2012CJ41-6]|uniref:non-specific protein-tyrosine kinase n=1 Tax=Ruegeria spongiae TaxID=2942209 RepID=A0ABT0Q7V6_9RHOB|nr:polysaccharide biosynthesis tyrosine autokinase [Ruegeria spongiae]MCL6285642.1 polysaccharide biosynthesis tyrosine autokinase [Ruegeria spongiae]